MTETWLPVPGYTGSYEVSSQGRVRSLERMVRHSSSAMRVQKGRILRAAIGSHGYPVVNLRKDGRGQVRTVHSIVAAAFMGPRANGQQVRHLNGDRTDARLDNLAYGTQAENEQDKATYGVEHHNAVKTHCPRGHLLEQPNLVARAWRRGHRECLACNRATGYLRYHGLGPERMQAVADSYHQKIMKD